MSTESMERLAEEIKQLQEHKGPYYYRWLRHYRQAVEGGKCGGDSRYVEGMKSFLRSQDKKAWERLSEE